MKRVMEYEGWKIEALPVMLVKQRLFQASVVISHGNERFVFCDLGNRVDREQALRTRYRVGHALDRHQLPASCAYRGARYPAGTPCPSHAKARRCAPIT